MAIKLEPTSSTHNYFMRVNYICHYKVNKEDNYNILIMDLMGDPWKIYLIVVRGNLTVKQQ